MKKIQIAIAEDHVMFRQGLISLLKEFKDCNVLFDVNNGKELIDELANSKPDIILLDIDMPVMGGREALGIIRENYPDIKVIIISMHFERPYIIEFIRNGASAFLQKSCFFEELITTVNAVNEYGYYYEGKVSEVMIREIANNNNRNSTPLKIKLTERETEVLNLLLMSKSNIQIAESLGISVRTVEGHRQHLLQKTGSKNIVALISQALGEGLIESYKPDIL
jgi:DNA-binding NarL/FixJ family response regulator